MIGAIKDQQNSGQHLLLVPKDKNNNMQKQTIIITKLYI